MKKLKKLKVMRTPSTQLEELPNEHYQSIFALVRNQLQVDFSGYKITTVSRRIQRQMKLNKIDSIAKYTKYLESKPEAVRILCDDVFIHVTEFFRDPESFKYLEKSIFPRLLNQKSSDTPVRIWVPGCSTGEEAYSIAISLLEYTAKNKKKISFQIFATDISEPTLQEARTGLYSAEDLKNIPQVLIKKYFDQQKENYRIKRMVRDLFVFSRHDLTSNPPFAKIDLISCRNVLIYFAPNLQKHVIPIFHYALNTDGFLWLGKTETPIGISKLFTLIEPAHKIFSKIQTATPMTFRSPVTSLCTKNANGDGIKVNPPPLDPQKEFDRVVLARYAPSGITVNSDLEILHLRGDNSPYLSFGSGQPNYNLLKMLRPELLPGIRMSLQSAQKKNASIKKEALNYEFAGERRKVTIEVVPINIHFPLKERQYVILFDETSLMEKKALPKVEKRPSKNKNKKTKGEDNYAIELLQEIDSMRDYQQSLAEGYEATQEELTSSNEELQSTLEEIQSTNEELETAKEELQASNEELITINDELQHRNEELIIAVEKAARAEERVRLMIEAVKDYAIFMLDPEGNVATWNEGARRIKGYEESEIIGKHFSKFFLPEDINANCPQKKLEIAKKEGKYEEEGIRVRKDGTTFYAHALITTIRDDKGNLRGFSKVTRDISEKKAAEKNLIETESRYRQMIDSIQDYAIFRLDPLGRIVTWSGSAERLKGYSADEIIGKHFSIFYPEEKIKENFPEYELQEAAKNGRFEDEGWRIRKDGSRFWANVVITRLADNEGNLLGFTKVTRDLSERKKSEEAIREANEQLEERVKERTQELNQALSIREEFLSIASHELKTPLTSLKLQLQVSQKNVDSQNSEALSRDKLSSSFKAALREVDALTSLVDDLLDSSKIQSGKFTLSPDDVDLTELIREVVARFGQQLITARIDLQMSLTKNIVGVWDRQRLNQVLINLISNAIKYAPKSQLMIETLLNSDHVDISISDTGPGIPKDRQGKIFERFERVTAHRNIGGLGLGLFIVKTIVESHGGKISVESDTGKGTTFLIRLPLAPTYPEELVFHDE